MKVVYFPRIDIEKRILANDFFYPVFALTNILKHFLYNQYHLQE